MDCIDHDAAARARAAADRVAAEAVLEVLQAAADSVRLRLLAAVVEQPGLCACDLAWVVDRQKSLVSHHLKRLRDAGLVVSEREGRLVRFEATGQGAGLVRAVGELAGTEVAA